MKDLYLATYSYGPARLSTREMVKTAKELGFQGMEFLSPLDKEMAAALREYDMKVIDTMEGPDEVGNIGSVDLLHELGINRSAAPIWWPSAITSRPFGRRSE